MSNAKQQNAQSMMLTGASNSNNEDMLFSEQFEFPIIDPEEIRPEVYKNSELRQMMWDKVIQLLDTTLLFDISKVKEHKQSVIMDVAKSSQELDMQVVNFILNCLLPNSIFTFSGNSSQSSQSETQRMLEQSLVKIIDRGCSNQTGYGLAAAGQGQNINLSRYCFNNMFELCRF